MESNHQVEARRVIAIAERKIAENDYVGAKDFVNKAQNLYPNLEGLTHVSIMIDVYISAARKINGGQETDWYRILGVDPSADDEDVKKQYKKLALLLHPDKNKCNGAEGAFKLVLEAWSLLSDKAKRIAYDQRRPVTQKPPNPHKPASCNKPATVNPTGQKRGGTFWTMCYGCKTQCEYLRDFYLNRAILCPNCGQTFIATEKTPSTSFVSPFKFSSSPQQRRQQWSCQNEATNNNTNGASYLPYASAAQKPPQASAKRGKQASAKRGKLRNSIVFPTSCSVSARDNYSSRNGVNQSQERSKRVLQETIEKLRKKLRTDVR